MSSRWSLLPATLLLLLLQPLSVASQQKTLRDLLYDESEISFFREALNAVGFLEDELNNPDVNLTIFAPTNEAVNASAELSVYLSGIINDYDIDNAFLETTTNETTIQQRVTSEKVIGPEQSEYQHQLDQLPNWHWNLITTVNNHIVPDARLLYKDIFDSRTTLLISRTDSLSVSQFLTVVGGANIVTSDLQASNGVLHIINRVMKPKYFEHTLANLEITSEFGPDISVDPPRVSLQTITDHIGDRARQILNQVTPTGFTQIGCRIRALNRIGLDYLPQTINDAPEGIKFGEFMNASFTNETFDNLIRYSLLPRMYYRQDIPDGYQELTMGVNQCAHMWITKERGGRLCFNDGCQVDDPGPRETMASNGIAYVVDKCIVCPGVAMLTYYASEYTKFNMKDSAQFWIASEWNLRNMSRSIGDGTSVTMFASSNTGWDVVNLQDVERLATDKWKPHMWDLLKHNMVQGVYLEQDLRDMYESNGDKEFNMTSLAGQNITIGYNKEQDVMTVGGGDLFYPDIKGVDGIVHFTTAVSFPLSMTHSVYDVATTINNFTTQVALIDGVFLREDMRRLLPLTALFANNFGWEGKIVQLEDIAETVLENMMFENLLWCDTLRNMENQRVESLNGQSWFVTINEDDMPCFDTLQVFGGPSFKACILTCDILAKNGLVHELDTIMLYETPETLGPQAPTTPTVRPPGAPTWNVPSISSSTDAGITPGYSGSFGASGGGAPQTVPGETVAAQDSAASWATRLTVSVVSMTMMLVLMSRLVLL